MRLQAAAHRDFDAEVLATIAAHHERFDGTGYPRGLEGMSIPLPAEMAASPTPIAR